MRVTRWRTVQTVQSVFCILAYIQFLAVFGSFRSNCFDIESNFVQPWTDKLPRRIFLALHIIQNQCCRKSCVCLFPRQQKHKSRKIPKDTDSFPRFFSGNLGKQNFLLSVQKWVLKSCPTAFTPPPSPIFLLTYFSPDLLTQASSLTNSITKDWDASTSSDGEQPCWKASVRYGYGFSSIHAVTAGTSSSLQLQLKKNIAIAVSSWKKRHTCQFSMF